MASKELEAKYQMVITETIINKLVNDIATNYALMGFSWGSNMQYKEVTSLFLATKLNIPYNVFQLPHPLIHQKYTSSPYPLL